MEANLPITAAKEKTAELMRELMQLGNLQHPYSYFSAKKRDFRFLSTFLLTCLQMTYDNCCQWFKKCVCKMNTASEARKISSETPRRINRVNKKPGISLLISKLSLSSTYVFSEKQENLEHCCDILRKELKLLFTLEGILTLFTHTANDTKELGLLYKQQWNTRWAFARKLAIFIWENITVAIAR